MAGQPRGVAVGQFLGRQRIVGVVAATLPAFETFLAFCVAIGLFLIPVTTPPTLT
jgi:hypothetical protein